MFIIYDLIFLLYSLIYFPYLVITRRWFPGFEMRFGFWPSHVIKDLAQSRNIWIHAVSVGEVMAIEGLVREIKQRWPDYTVVCSVTTKTGLELAQERLSLLARIIPSPLDFSFTVRMFIRYIRPQLYIGAETEIWPNLFTCLHQKNVPVVIVNGRISDRSFGRYQRIKFLLNNILNKVNVFAMQSVLDAERIIAMGADKAKVKVVGNIKFDEFIQAETTITQILPQPVWIAGSTHPGEEEIILDAFKKSPSGWRLVIAPRHVERVLDVMKLIEQRGWRAIKFSQYKGEDGVIVVDTIGHLKALYAQAELVFVGKSLCVGGGHNVIEPAFFSKPIIIGPMTENFRDIVRLFKSEQAIVQVKDQEEFKVEVMNLMADVSRRRSLGQKARTVVNQNQGATLRTMEIIQQWL